MGLRNNHRHHAVRGALAGVAGGLVASWVMNEFMTGPGQRIQKSVQWATSGDRQRVDQKTNEEESATTRMADTIVEFATGGRHLSREGREKGGVAVHYGYGALMGGLYGTLAEFWHTPKAGLGTAFGSVLFGAGDILAIPALNLGPSPAELPVSSLTNPFLSHLVYGTTTELIRRAIRPLL